ncbi:MAG: hypothetical protein HYV06_06495 [Deltaproteobacteria bacterium]|nr:hypothetical protein [Deltaproteobacteria bacterium]
MTRGNSFHGLCRELGQIAKSFREGVAEVDPAWEKLDFFSSYETSYSLTLAYPDDILIESARKMGIAVEGREKIAIVREMLERGVPAERDDHEPV